MGGVSSDVRRRSRMPGGTGGGAGGGGASGGPGGSMGSKGGGANLAESRLPERPPARRLDRLARPKVPWALTLEARKDAPGAPACPAH